MKNVTKDEGGILLPERRVITRGLHINLPQDHSTPIYCSPAAAWSNSMARWFVGSLTGILGREEAIGWVSLGSMSSILDMLSGLSRPVPCQSDKCLILYCFHWVIP
jgi:hypothetical protein